MAINYGTTGGETLTGTAQADIVQASTGTDIVTTGDGDDVIFDEGLGGNISSGAGDDRIAFGDGLRGSIFDGVSVPLNVDSGDGHDDVDIFRTGPGALTIALGAGNDTLRLSGHSWSQNASIDLGTGQDLVSFGFDLGNALRFTIGGAPVAVTGFTAGAGGDVLNLGELIRGFWFNASTALPSANPFASGHLVLVQQGADTIVRLDYDGFGLGAGENYTRDIVKLVGISPALLVAANFAGYAPAGGAPSLPSSSGTGANDLFLAAAVGGQYSGSAGDDRIVGNAGADDLAGDGGHDWIDGGAGNDWLRGGDGNDTISDSLGNDVIDGGGGDDVISLTRPNGISATPLGLDETVSIAGGDGNDRVAVSVVWEPFVNAGVRRLDVTADLGAGNDYFFLENWASTASVTLGAGQDRVELGEYYLSNYEDLAESMLVIADFTPGDSGDVLDLGGMLIGTEWNLLVNPFADGRLHLFQQGADTIVAVDFDGAGGSGTMIEIIRLANVFAASLTAFNFDGYAPNGAAVAAATRNGTGNADWIEGAGGADTINGLDGADRLDGGFGNDVIDGGPGDDRIDGGYGNDQLQGGDGDDLVEDRGGGSDTLNGGDGDDRIVVYHRYFATVLNTIVINGGAGADLVEFTSGTGGTLSVDLGTGDDRLVLHSLVEGGTTLTLGGGRDTIVLDPALATQVRGPLVITDFATGDLGDRLDWLLYAQFKTFEPGATFNPFLAGVATLQQSGADTWLMLDGVAGPAVVFSNTSRASFTNYNLGTDISLAPPVPEPDTQTGTAGDDLLDGTSGRDVISGLAGADRLSGLGASDLLKGGDGNDILIGGDGDDELIGGAGADNIDGGAGNDLIDDPTGEDAIAGGTGDDLISVLAKSGPYGTVDAGAGNDRLNLTLYTSAYGSYAVNMGAGDDHVRVGDMAWDIQLTLGTGRDTIELPAYFSALNGSKLIVPDFETGAAGDKVDVDGYLGTALLFWDVSNNWQPGTNPFALGYLVLRQNGADVELWFQPESIDDLYATRVIRFVNTSIAQFTADNFNGYDPHAPVNSAVIIRENLTIAPETVIEGVDMTAYFDLRPHYVWNSTHAAFINHGSVSTRSTDGKGALVGFTVSRGSGPSDAALFFNASDGEFLVESEWPEDFGSPYGYFSNTYGFYAPQQSIAFRNDGYFEVVAHGGVAHGVVTGFDSTANRSVVNNGDMVVLSAFEAYGIELGSSGSFENNGNLLVLADYFAVGIFSNQYHAQPIVNYGSITVFTDEASPWASVAILLPEIEAPFGGAYHHYNYGLIAANIAYFIYEVNETSGGYVDILHNDGEIQGAVLLGKGNDQVLNTGVMDGRTLLQEGDDTYQGQAGFHYGSIEGGAGNDVLTGGADRENLYGDSGNDLILGGGGDDYVDGGSGSDLLDGGDGIDMIAWLDSLMPVEIDLGSGTARTQLELDYFANFEIAVGSRGGDTIYGSATRHDLLFGFLGDDRIDGRAGDDTIVGGRGNDILTGGAGVDYFVFELGDGADEIVDFAAGDRIEIYGFGGAQGISQIGADVRIALSATDSILVRSASVAGVMAGLLFDPNPLDLDVPGFEDEPLRLYETMAIGAGVAFELGDVRPLVRFNAPTTATALILESGIGLFNAGSLAFTTTDPALETIGVQLADAAVGGASETFVNRATGSIDVEATGADAVGINGVDLVWNLGTISVASAHGDAVGVGDLTPYASTLVNTGSILVNAAEHATGVADSHASTIGDAHYFNSGQILVHGGLASIGFELHQVTLSAGAEQPSFVNSGIIAVTDGTAIADSVGVNIVFAAKASIWNSGSIAADFAVRVQSGISGGGVANLPNGLSLYNSGTLTGLVYLSEWADLIVNTHIISGSIVLGAGNDLYDGRFGTLTGSVDGGAGNDSLLAGAGNQLLSGGLGDDILSGGAGADQLIGGGGRDSFRFEAGGGQDEIVDFDRGSQHDYIDIAGYAAYQSIAQVGADVLITFSASDRILIRSATLASITPAMLRFGAAPIAAQLIPAAPTAPAAPADPIFIPAPIAPIVGTGGPDSLTGSLVPDDLRGLGGNDRLDGAAGIDRMTGGAGDDLYLVDHGDDVIVELPGEGTDSVESSTGYALGANVENLALTGNWAVDGTGNGLANVLTGNDAANQLAGGGGNDVLRGGAGNDRLIVSGAGLSTVEGGADLDTLVVAYGDASTSIVSTLPNFDPAGGAIGTIGDGAARRIDYSGIENFDVTTGSGDDEIWGGQNVNIVRFGGGNDRFIGSGGSNQIDGGTGEDGLSIGFGNATAAILWNLATGALSGATGSYTGFEYFIGLLTGSGNDVIVTTSVARPDLIFLGAGNDSATMLNGQDHVDGEGGSDLLVIDYSGAATAIVTTGGAAGITADVSGFKGQIGDGGARTVDFGNFERFDVRTGSGNDNIVLGTLGLTTNDVVNLGAGDDFVDFGRGVDQGDGGSGVDGLAADISLAGPGISFNLNTGIFSGIAGFSFVNFEYFGGTGFQTGQGNDNIVTLMLALNDRVLLGAGNDSVTVFNGQDNVDGHTGIDLLVIDYSGASAAIVTTGGAAGITADMSGFKGQIGDGAGRRVDFRNVDRFDIRTGSGNDNIVTAGGNDEIRTGLGTDTLIAGAGDDLLDGGAGADAMTGGAGNDLYFVDHAGDTVTELSGEGNDTISTALAAYILAAHVENLTGSSAAGQTLTGNSGNNVVNAGSGNDVLRLYDGGNDSAFGGAGLDTFFFIGSLTSADIVNGGDGVDTLVVQGPYGALTLSANVTQIENVSILGGNNTNFGEPGTNRYDYVLTTHNANFAAGVQARINGSALLAGEDFTFDGSAETDGLFVVYGGKGVDTLTGGFGNDIFIYAEERFAPGDTVNGGPGGYDGIFFRGNYTIDFNAPGYFGLMTSIENMTLTSATDERYARGGGTEFDYNITLADNQLLAGVELTISGALLMATETMILDGSLETDGTFRIFGGKANDTLKGGANADLLHGNLGADLLTGNGGADSFRYQNVAESNAAAMDHILDFTPGTDKIELDRIDANTLVAGNQAFTFIGSGAFTNSAGQLRAYQSGADWFVEGDTNGDGVADLVIALTLQGPVPLGAGDFIL